MITNFIYTVLLLIVGSVIVAAILLFGVKFWKDGDKPSEDVTCEGIVLHLLKNYPFWIWIIVFLVFQPAIIHIINVWTPTLWTSCGWIPKFSDFIGFITVLIFFVIFYMTDDSGKLKLFKKSEWNLIKETPFVSERRFLIFLDFFVVFIIYSKSQTKKNNCIWTQNFTLILYQLLGW